MSADTRSTTWFVTGASRAAQRQRERDRAPLRIQVIGQPARSGSLAADVLLVLAHPFLPV